MTQEGTGSPRADWNSRFQNQVWPNALLLAIPAVIAGLLNQPGSYVGDNRFEQYWAPGWRVVRETMLWEGTRGMGRVGEEFWPITIPIAFLRSLGFSPAATQHIWHALILVVAGTGALCVVRAFQPRIGVAHLVAGVVYMCNPFSVSFLVPSNLYWNYALAPWLLVCALNGVRATDSRARWRWAAIWALLVFSAGDTDIPGLAFAVAWVVPALIFAVLVERWVSWAEVWAWVLRAGLLTVAVSAAAFVKVAMGANALGQRLLFTESPLEVNNASSWSESFRGLGYWVSYYRTPGRDFEIPGALMWWESALGVIATFALPVIALLALWRLRWRTRLLFIAIAVPSLIVMVGAFNPQHPPPGGALLLAAYRTFPSLSSLRNTYKAGSGLLLAVSVLVGIGTSALLSWSARQDRSWVRPAASIGLLVVVITSSIPFWNGGLYPPDRQMESIPPYWTDATDWLEEQPGDARVLILPGSTQTAYRWGWVGDDILDTLLRRHPPVTPTNFPVSGPLTANVVDALETRIREGSLTPEMLVPIAQRLGVGWVVVRNDMDWKRIREPRPALLDDLRNSDDLPLLETFGKIGENTTDPADDSEDAAAEAKLHPIEIYRVPPATEVDGQAASGAVNQQLARPTSSPLLVDGDGTAWPTLATRGLLESSRPLRFAGAASEDDVATALRDEAAALVVTDTNRRRLTLIRGPGPTSSETLASEQQLEQAPQDLFGVPGTQSVAVYPDAESISASGSGTQLLGFNPIGRPANAFDGLDSTAWRDGGFGEATGRWVQVDFRKPVAMSTLSLTPWINPNGTLAVAAAAIHFDDGSRVDVKLPPREKTVDVDFATRSTRALRVEVTEVRGEGDGSVGFTEIEVPDVDLTEYIAAPDHLFKSDNKDLQEALASGDVSYLFRRSIGTVADPEELRLRRQFESAGTRSWNLTARFSQTNPPVDQLVDGLIGGATGAFGSSRLGLPSESRGGLALDRDPATAWAGEPRVGERLNIRFAERPIDRVNVTLLAGPSDYPAQALEVKVAGQEVGTIELDAATNCPDSTDCPRSGELRLDTPITAGTATLTLADGDGGGRPVRIAEVTLDGPDGEVPRSKIPADSACARGLITVDDKPVDLRADGSVLDALDAGGVTLVSCATLELPGGTHRLATSASARVDEIQISPLGSTGEAAQEAGAATEPMDLTLLDRSPTSLMLDVEADVDGLVVSGQSFDENWRAEADGKDLGTPFEVEGQSAWRVPEGTSHLRLWYAPQDFFSIALAVTGLGLLVSLALVLRSSGTTKEPDNPVYGPRVPSGEPPQ